MAASYGKKRSKEVEMSKIVLRTTRLPVTAANHSGGMVPASPLTGSCVSTASVLQCEVSVPLLQCDDFSTHITNQNKMSRRRVSVSVYHTCGAAHTHAYIYTMVWQPGGVGIYITAYNQPKYDEKKEDVCIL